MIDIEKTVFLLTYTGAGALGLQSRLSGQPGICLRGERGGLLPGLALSWHNLTNFDPMNGVRKKGEETAQTHPWFGAERIRPALCGHHLAEAFTREALDPPPGARITGFRLNGLHHTPGKFTPVTEFLRRFFPSPYFIFVLRDPTALAATEQWRDRPAKEREILLPAFHRKAEAFITRHPAAAMKLDDLGNEDPDATLNRVLRFIGEPPLPG